MLLSFFLSVEKLVYGNVFCFFTGYSIDKGDEGLVYLVNASDPEQVLSARTKIKALDKDPKTAIKPLYISKFIIIACLLSTCSLILIG